MDEYQRNGSYRLSELTLKDFVDAFKRLLSSLWNKANASRAISKQTKEDI